MAQRLGISRPTVAESVRRAQAAGVSWPLSPTLDEAAVERRLFPPHPTSAVPPRPAPDWATVHHALQRKGVPLFLLWQEYKRTTPEGVQYSRFCQGSRRWTGKRDLVMRQSHCAGEPRFVDSAGQGLPVVNPRSGEGHAVALFVAVLGASSSPSAEATWTQSLPDWIGSPVRTFAALGGCQRVSSPILSRPQCSGRTALSLRAIAPPPPSPTTPALP